MIMKTQISTAILIILSLFSLNLYSQVKTADESNDSEEDIVKVTDADVDRLIESARANSRSSGRSREHASERSYSSFSYGDGVYVMSNSGSSSSQLSLSKSFKGESKKNEGSFDIDENVRNISLNLSGRVESGEIKIKIVLFNGDIIKELNIDESADIQFNQNISIAKDEKKYYGKWRYTIESVKANGNYRLMISTR